MSRLDLSHEQLEAFLEVPADTTTSQLLDVIGDRPNRFVLVRGGAGPVALLSGYQVIELAEAGSQPLKEIWDSLPPLILVDGRDLVLGEVTLGNLVDVLQTTRAPGLVVWQDGQAAGILPRKRIAQVYFGDLGSELRGAGGPNIPVARFVCKKHPEPYPEEYYLGNGRPPNCPQDWSHGPMERA